VAEVDHWFWLQDQRIWEWDYFNSKF
jgi:hypothetical protein